MYKRQVLRFNKRNFKQCPNEWKVKDKFCVDNSDQPCISDRGGPLVCRGQEGTAILAGIGGLIDHCPKFFTNITYFSGWINKILVIPFKLIINLHINR